MKKIRLKDLDRQGCRHVLESLVPGRYLSAGGISFKKPGERSHDAGCRCEACDGNGRHVHRGECEVFVLLQGKACMEIDGVPHPVAAGDVIVAEPGEDHHLVADKNDPCVNLYLHAADLPNIRQRPV